MTAKRRTANGRFPPGISGNRKGRPTDLRRIRELYEAELVELGASQEEIDTLVAVGADKAKGVAAVVALSAAVVELIQNPHSVRRTRFNHL